MSSALLSRLRELRRRVEILNDSCVEDYVPFYDKPSNSFVRIPTKPLKPGGDLSVATTATALMALGSVGRIHEVLAGPKVIDCVNNLFNSKWETDELKVNNAFTTGIVLRAMAAMRQAGPEYCELIDRLKRTHNDPAEQDPLPGWRTFVNMGPGDIAAAILNGAPDSLAVHVYPPTPAIGYWILDAAFKLGASLSKELLLRVGQWFTSEFRRQVSLVSANHTALMDPIALAMAAAACKLIGRHWFTEIDQTPKTYEFPSDEELRYGVLLFFSRQNDAGVWEKYFPMFHYPTAGSNHCWHFEVLEAVLAEFPQLVGDGSAVINEMDVLAYVSRSVDWLESNRLHFNVKEHGECKEYAGWNTGGQVATLAKGEPESWANGVVHMFLDHLHTCLSGAIRKEVLRKFGISKRPVCDGSEWDKAIDTHLEIGGGKGQESLKTCIEYFTIDPLLKSTDGSGGKSTALPKEVKQSALLFGPPGTGKTRYVKAIAEKLGWEFVEITPADLLHNGIEGIYLTTKTLFDDLLDLDRVVVFFDEMDAMLRRRDEQTPLPVEQQFLTTSMLPHLAKLTNKRKVLYFFATNHKQTFDAAITRAGRFDMLLYVGPPSWNEKIDSLVPLAKLTDSEAGEAKAILETWVGAHHKEQLEALDWATFGEARVLFDEASEEKSLIQALRSGELTKDKFLGLVEQWRERDRFSLLADADAKVRFKAQSKQSEVRL